MPGTKQFRLRRATQTEWAADNPVLAAGEFGVETNTGRYKVGDNATAWNALAYFAGGAGSGGTFGSITTTGNVTVGGDLTVNGTTTTINSTVVTVDDKLIELGSTPSPTDVSADGGGIVLKGTTDKSITWLDATDSWTFNQSVELGSGLGYRIDGVQVLSKTALGSTITSSNLTSVGTLSSGTWNANTIAVAFGGTGATTAAGARTNLGLAIGSDVQAYDTELNAIAGLTSAADKLPYFTGSGTADLATFTSFGRSLVDDTSSLVARRTLGIDTLLEYDTSIDHDYVQTTGYGGLSLDDVTVEAGNTLEIPDGHTWTVLATTQLDATQLRDANKVYVGKTGSDSNNGTSLAEPLLTLSAAAAAAQPGDIVFVAPGTYVEASLPIRWKRNVSILGSGLRNTVIQPASGQEYNDIFKVDSGFYCWGLSFAGHQADTVNGLQSWAVSFDELADNTALGASGLGAYIVKSPYVQNCTSITAEQDAGNAGSRSTGDTGGGINVDGSKCASNSPIRSMVVDSYTQVNLGGPGCLVQNDGYAQLVSFFGTFCTYHVRCQSGGQVNLSGGGTTDFGTYGLMADGYSPSPLFTGQARTSYFGASRIDKAVTITVATNLFSCTAHGLSAGDEVTFKASSGSLPTGITVGTTFYVISSGLTADAFKVSATSGGSSVSLSGTATGTYSVIRQGVLSVDVVSLTANRLGALAASRPNAGQLMFPQLVFPRDSTTKLATAKTFAYTRTGNFTLTFTEAASASGPDHEYVNGGTAVIGGTNYGVAGAVYNKTTGVVTLTTVTQLPAGNGNVTVNGLNFICPTSAYVVTSSVPIDSSGVEVANNSPSRAGYRVNFYNAVNGGLINSLTSAQVLDFRARSQISAPSHTFEYVGSGTNYDALPWNGGVPVPANAIVETNNGQVFSSNTNEKGDFAVGSQFSVDGTTGTVTINTSQFNLSGLNFIGPFSRNGGFSTVGVQLQEVSNNTSLIASTGTADGNTVPTQAAVKAYAAPLASPALTGTPTAPTAAVDTNTTQLATTQFVLGQAASTTPAANGTAAVGTSLRYARADHVHASQITRSTQVVTASNYFAQINTADFSGGAYTYNQTKGTFTALATGTILVVWYPKDIYVSSNFTGGNIYAGFAFGGGTGNYNGIESLPYLIGNGTSTFASSIPVPPVAQTFTVTSGGSYNLNVYFYLSGFSWSNSSAFVQLNGNGNAGGFWTITYL